MVKFGAFLVAVIILLALIGFVQGDDPDLIPDTLLFDQLVTKDWLVANGTDRCTYIVRVLNQSIPISNLDVQFTVLDQDMGFFTPQNTRTNSDGIAESQFIVKHKSGDAPLVAKVTYSIDGVPGSIENSTIQKIDHDTPYRISSYNLVDEKTVGTTTTIQIGISDRWNNPVDNRRLVETVYFEVGSPSSMTTNDPNSIPAKFWNQAGGEYVTSIYVPVDAAGIASAALRLDTRPGANIVYVKPNNMAIPARYFTIQGVADGEPHGLIQSIDPPTLEVPAHMDYLFTITYTMTDQWGNGLANHAILWNTSRPNENEIIYTNHLGWAKRTYGPSGYQGAVDISAKPEENQSIVRTATLHFINTTAVDMVLTANPQTMPSGDVPVSSPISVIAKVVDIMGNPVKNMPVDFSIIHSASYPVAQTKTPSFHSTDSVDAIQELTDTGGQAIVQFYPGHFETNSSKLYPEYDEQASASCTVRATWMNETGTSIVRDIALTWKNYPWISVKTSASPLQVPVNETVDVMVQIIGDGWALQPKPIDVILVIDVSGSMGGTNYGTRMQPAMNAAKDFVGSMNASKDRIGLVSFSSSANLVRGLTNDTASLNSSIDALNPVGATNLREAYYVAISHLKENGRDNAVKAVVAMTDGDWNNHGSPLAKGIGFPDNDTRLSTYDASHYTQGVPLSSFPWLCTAGGYTFNPGSCIIRDSAGGTNQYFEGYEWYSDMPGDKGNLSEQKYWYRRYNPSGSYNAYHQGWVCRDGQTTNQNMSVFAMSGTRNKQVRLYSIGFAQTLNANVVSDLTTLSKATGGWYAWAGNEAALKSLYAAIAGELREEASVDTSMEISYKEVTIESKYPGGEVFDYIPIADKSTYIRSYYTNNTPIGTPSYQNDLSNWTAANNYTLRFNIGTIKLNQVWEATYTLRVKKPGNINLFENNAIAFNSTDNIQQTIHLPDVFITAAYNLTNVSISTPILELSEITETRITDYTREWNWTRNYTGEGTLIERYWISVDDGKQWVLVEEKEIPDAKTNKIGVFRIDLRTIERGVENSDKVMFRVEALAEGTQSPVRQQIDTLRANGGHAFIKLF